MAMLVADGRISADILSLIQRAQGQAAGVVHLLPPGLINPMHDEILQAVRPTLVSNRLDHQ